MALHDLLTGPVRGRADHPAIVEGDTGDTLTYGEFDRLSNRVRDRLAASGVRPGDRVGLCLPKSADTLAAIFGILKVGAAYVPVDATAPAARNAYIHHNCQASVVFVERGLERQYGAELEALGAVPRVVVLDGPGGGRALGLALDAMDRTLGPPPVAGTAAPADDELAYILYTSGSTGTPKGVMLTHRNAVAFVDWCSQVFEPTADDVFSSHAPFHFDLSILDIYVPLKHGATLVLVPEKVGKEPKGLADLIARHRITCWYSAPSTLAILAQSGRLPALDFSSLRLVLFAGEVFPVVHLRSLTTQWTRPRFFNLYGPTETNVCTYYEVRLPVPDDRSEPYPIGPVCEHLDARVVDADGRDVSVGQEGELVIAGPNVMSGYWAQPDLTEAAFLSDDDGRRWYRTGDLVVEEASTGYRYVGRRDRMVKKRGYRIELGEIEACLYRHPDVREAAVVALPDNESGIHVRAHLALHEGRTTSLIGLKTFCAAHLPAYMIPDTFAFHSGLKRTSTDKVDYQWLKSLGLNSTT